jgi:hypothetical protein
MAYESLQAVVGTAVIDSLFRKALLNGSRRRVIQTFNLTNEETSAVMAIRADSLEQFARQLDQWIATSQGRRELPPLILPKRPNPFAWHATP